MKKIAFYLPQFHAIPENDKWWGKGFTEWSNVKNSKPSFKGHYQPERPLKGNYYDLLDPHVQEQQSVLAQKYGIDGFCYYHYWFEGKLLLEKPMENMLHNSNVTIPFCVCWANESWARTWDGSSKKVLIEQNYNEDNDGLIKHLDYLLPFFKDDRYIKIDNKPVFIIYKPYLMTNLEQTMQLWNTLAKKNGFDGIYWGFQHHSCFEHLDRLTSFDFGIEFEPFYTVWKTKKNKKESIIRKLKRKVFHLPVIYNYDKIWKNMIGREPLASNIMPGIFPSWDNTPRRGRRAFVFKGATPQKFEKYIVKKLEKLSPKYLTNFIFINAWNEWAEGAHLEPDEKNKYGYLEAFKRAFDKYNCK